MQFNDSEEITNYVNLFVSVIICFPEVATIKYDRDSNEIFFNFILKNYSEIPNFEKNMDNISQALAAYHRIEDGKSYDFSVEIKSINNYAVLVARRDMKSVTREEISFLIELFKTSFYDNLLMESVDKDDENDYQWFQTENDENHSEKKRIKFDEKSIGNKILFCREAGKVLVFSNS